jgi:hypothetical protein
MEAAGSLLCSQDPSTGPFPEPDASSPRLPIYFPKIYSNVIIPSTPMSSVFPTEILYAFLIGSIWAIYPTHLILLDFTTRIFGEA